MISLQKSINDACFPILSLTFPLFLPLICDAPPFLGFIEVLKRIQHSPSQCFTYPRFSPEVLERIQYDPDSIGKRPLEFHEGDIIGFSIQTRHLLDNALSTDNQSLILEFMKNSAEICKELAISENDVLDSLYGENVKEVLHHLSLCSHCLSALLYH